MYVIHDSALVYKPLNSTNNNFNWDKGKLLENNFWVLKDPPKTSLSFQDYYYYHSFLIHNYNPFAANLKH